MSNPNQNFLVKGHTTNQNPNKKTIVMRKVEFLMDKGVDQTGIQKKVNEFLANHPNIKIHDIKFTATPTNPDRNTWQIWSVMIDYEVEG